MAGHIVVVGGGFAGFWAAVAARRVGGPELTITLVAPEPVLVMRPRHYEARPETLGVDLIEPLATVGAAFVRGTATGIDSADRQLELSDGRTIRFDRLVVATGSVMRRPALPGADQAYSIDTQADAVTFDRALSKIASDAVSPTIAVIGAGFTGTELALELRDRVGGHAGVADAERLRIVLIDRTDVVGAELGPGPRPAIESALRDAGVEVWLGRRVSGLSATRVTFDDGSVLDADAVVLTTGMEAAPFVSRLPGEKDAVGRAVVDAYLRAPQAPEIFVAGDASAADTGDGHRALLSCQHALQLGRVAGENAARDLMGLPLVPYEQLRYVTCLDLGRSGAVLTQGWDRAVVMEGPDAKAIKRKINTEIIYPPIGATADVLLRQSELDPAARN